MSADKDTNSRQAWLIIFSFHVALFCYPLLSFLWRRAYPVFSLEMAVLLAVVLFFSVLLTFVVVNIRQVLARMLTLILIVILFMIQFNMLLEGILVCFTVSLIFIFLTRRSFHLYGLPILVALIIGAYFDSFEDPGHVSTKSSPPANLGRSG